MQPAAQQPESLYGDKFFNEIAEGSLSSAQVIVPYLMELLNPKSVLDVGCAEGAWLVEFKSRGVTDYHGIDGDYVDRARLLIDADKFSAIDLSKGFSLGRNFELAICLEVAEHLSTEAADRLVGALVRHAPCIAFSASIPYQDGTGHINEQWPDYWVKLFRSHGYEAMDCIRPRVWSDKRVRWWFAQNTIIYFDPKNLTLKSQLSKFEQIDGNLLPLVHPELLLHKQRCLEYLRQKEMDLQQIEKRAKSIRWLIRQIAKILIRGNRQNDKQG